MSNMTIEAHRRGSKDKISDEDQERDIAVMKVQLEVLQGWLQEEGNECRIHGWRMKEWVRWNLLQKKWNAKLMNKFKELE